MNVLTRDWRDTVYRNHVRLFVLIALVAATACSGSGCTTWRAQKETADQVLAKKPSTRELRVTLAPEGLVVTVLKPRVEADSLRGVVAKPPKGFPTEWLRGAPAWDAESGTWSGRHVVIPPEPIRKVEILTTDVLGTTAIVVVLGLTAAAMVVNPVGGGYGM